MRAFRDSLVDLRVFRRFCSTPNMLADFSAQCTQLENITLELDSNCANEFLGVLLARVGRTLSELNLGVHTGLNPGQSEVAHPTYLA